MILSRLILNDFGVFHGSQSFDLTPKRSRPIILVGGKNGAGKSSILEAIRLCFYGPAALGLRSREEYLAYLGSKIHLNPTALIQPQFASITVDFQYGDMRALHTYSVTRGWEKKNSTKIHETLTVTKNGKTLDEVTAEHWQDFVRDLIPLGLSQLFFFDGEKIQNLAEDTTDQLTLAQAIKSLLGLDIVEGLQTDLAVYLSRLSKPLRQGRESQLEEVETKIAALKQQLLKARAERENMQTRLLGMRGEIQRIEHQIASEGGGFARNREKLIQGEAGFRARIDTQEAAIRELCAGLLPFALAPGLCSQLRHQLLKEEQEFQHFSAKQVLHQVSGEIVQKLPSIKLWKELHLTKTIRENAINELTSLIREHLENRIEGPNTVRVHSLSSEQREQLMSWLDQAINNVPGILSIAAAELERCYHELRRTQDELRKIPADDVLKPLLQQLHRSHEELGQASKRALALDEQVNSMEAELAEHDRHYRLAVERLAAEAATNSKIQLLPRIQSALEEYKSTLLVERVAKLQESVTECFNLLSRKKDSIRKITIDPTNFSITLHDRAGNPLRKSSLSAGEKQIYAISMLWGLAKTSGRPLPVIIDTPLARLDSDHRMLLAQNYFPVASHQVVILSTDTEVDRAYFHELKPSVAHSYHLTFDGSVGGTTNRRGYFWEEVDETHQTEVNKGRLESTAVSGR
jgi:DNA sulfur modification protein DndD